MASVRRLSRRLPDGESYVRIKTALDAQHGMKSVEQQRSLPSTGDETFARLAWYRDVDRHRALSWRCLRRERRSTRQEHVRARTLGLRCETRWRR